jgi:hypothetical protein
MAAVVLALLAGCGSSDNGAKAQSFEEALGLDQASMEKREAKVQEAIRQCMKDEGFEYIPDTSGEMRFSFGPGSGPTGDPDFKRTKGYGITTTFGEEPPSARSADSDPNAKIREALSEEDKRAYDIALHGQAEEDMKTGGPAGGGVIIRREAGGDSEGPGDGGPDFSSMGCFGKAEKEIPGGPAELGSSLKDLFSRFESDPRVVSVNAKWRTCMSKAGYDQFDKQNDIPDYLFDKLQQLTGGADGVIRMGGDVDEDALSALQHEELTIARADDDCDKKVGLTKTSEKIRADLEQRFLDEHPNLTAGK